MKVNAMIIGAGRSGTTSVYEYLAAHPEVDFSITKELHYFSLDDLYARGEKYFHSFFEHPEKKISITADTYLLIDTKAPERICRYNPAMKCIIMLREPVARSYSNFLYSVNFGHEPASANFLQTMEAEKQVLATGDIVEQNNRCHFYGSLYHRHLEFWRSYFPKEQLLIYRMNDLQNDPEKFYKQLCADLGLNYQPFDKKEQAFNRSTGVKSKWLQQFLLNRESPLRRFASFMLRPFRKWVIKSGVIDKVYALNKKEIPAQPLNEADQQQAAVYFRSDLQLLERDYGIRF